MDANPYAETVIGGDDLTAISGPTRTQLRWLFVGLLITLLDFRLNNFNLLPDVLGFAIVFVVSLQLTHYSQHFRRAAGFAIALIIAFFLKFSDLNELHSVAWYVSQAGLTWTLMSGLAPHISVTRGEEFALFARKLAFVFAASQIFALAFDLLPLDFALIAVAVAAVGVVCTVIVLVVVWKAGSATSQSL